MFFCFLLGSLVVIVATAVVVMAGPVTVAVQALLVHRSFNRAEHQRATRHLYTTPVSASVCPDGRCCLHRRSSFKYQVFISTAEIIALHYLMRIKRIKFIVKLLDLEYTVSALLSNLDAEF